MKLKHIKTSNEEYYEDSEGLKQGEFKRHYHNGELNIHCYFKNDELHGLYKKHYINGQVCNICNYINGEISGEDVSYYCDGTHDETIPPKYQVETKLTVFCKYDSQQECPEFDNLGDNICLHHDNDGSCFNSKVNNYIKGD